MHRLVLVAAFLGFLLLSGPTSASTLAQDATPDACPTTTEDENVAAARIWHEEGTNNRNPDALFEILAPEVVHHAAGGFPNTMDSEGVVAMMSQFPPAFPDLHITMDFFVAEGDMVVERYTATGTQDGPLGDLPPSGRAATWTGINIFRFECGKIAEIWSEVDALSRLGQLTGEAEATPAP